MDIMAQKVKEMAEKAAVLLWGHTYQLTLVTPDMKERRIVFIQSTEDKAVDLALKVATKEGNFAILDLRRI